LGENHALVNYDYDLPSKSSLIEFIEKEKHHKCHELVKPAQHITVHARVQCTVPDIIKYVNEREMGKNVHDYLIMTTTTTTITPTTI
jgi:hypothetical protein